MGTMLVNLMHISVCRYDGAGAQCQSFGESAGSKILSQAETSFLKNIFELKQRKYPGIYALEPDILAGEIRDPAQEDSWSCSDRPSGTGECSAVSARRQEIRQVGRYRAASSDL